MITFLQPLQAQTVGDVVWVQIEAQPSLGEGLARAQDYATRLEDVNGFSLGTGWYAVALGPYLRADADQVLRVYRTEGLIPRDSYIAFSNTYAEQFYPSGADLLRRGAALSVPPVPALPEATEPSAETLVPLAPAESDPETLTEARLNERLLTREQRQQIQIALQDAGFYNATIDGAFGRGTRASMEAWQRANGFAPTGVLTTLQRAALIAQYNAVLDGLDLQLIRDAAAGIEMKLPMGVVAFERNDAPFAQYAARGEFAATVLLISQNGDADALAGLYDVMQSLEIVPLEGPRSLSGDGFSIVGRNAKIVSETKVGLLDGQIKGFTLIWPAGDETRRTRLMAEMEASFTRLDGVLEPASGAGADQQIDLIAGLQVRQPLTSRSGFYVDTRGSVVTTADAVQSCTRILLDDVVEARLSKIDLASGLALLEPTTQIAPPGVAHFGSDVPRLQSQVAVAGYSYGGRLNAPSMTFGVLEELRGLQGEADVKRLSLTSLPGDAGGPVFDDAGNVIGMLLSRSESDRRLPADVSFALAGGRIADILRAAGLRVEPAGQSAATAPEDITARGLDMTVLVTCWE
jgi:S1-C subfamily serine protease